MVAAASVVAGQLKIIITKVCHCKHLYKADTKKKNVALFVVLSYWRDDEKWGENL